VLAALSAPLCISCRTNGARLDASFSRGGLAEPVLVSPDPRPDATAIELVADPDVLPGKMDLDGLRRDLLEMDPEAAKLVRLERAHRFSWSAIGVRLEAP
jgi:hypothetical protein